MSNFLKEDYVRIKHPSGLNVLIWKKPGFSTVEAFFAAKYGSVNTRFKTVDNDDYVTTPEGIAHFLEHKLFENEDCDAFELYAQTGASANAYTSEDHTAYYFATSEDYKKPLEILLNFVQKPYFTEETVQKEQGIIAQEIKMLEDSPERKCYCNLLKALYKNNPIRVDIAGTVDSISRINADLLYKCYNTFYNLHNMTLAVAGDVDVEEIKKICDKCLIPAEDKKLEPYFPDEPEEVYQKEINESAQVGIPIFNIGFKTQKFSGDELIKTDIAASIILQVLFGSSSELYQQMLDEGLINSNFNYFTTFNIHGDYIPIITGESENPELVYDKCMDAVNNAKKNGLDRKMFEIIKKAKYSSFIRGYDDIDTCATLLLTADFLNVDVFEPSKALMEISYEDCMKAMNILFDTDKTAISIIDNK
ncbi:MAG: EF-P 5-aminopentanol modification-associated protein YfmH [Oscillospiraceae bacterium]